MNTNLEALKQMLLNLGSPEEEVAELTTIKDAINYFITSTGEAEGDAGTNEQALTILADIAPDIIGGNAELPKNGQVKITNNASKSVDVMFGAVVAYDPDDGKTAEVFSRQYSISSGRNELIDVGFPNQLVNLDKYSAHGLVLFSCFSQAITVTGEGFDEFKTGSVVGTNLVGNASGGIVCKFFALDKNQMPTITITNA